MNPKIYIPLVIVAIISAIFFYDIKYIRIRIISNEYPNIMELEKRYEECIEKKLGSPCEIMKNQLDMMYAKCPSILSSFFIWICEGFMSMFNILNFKNLILFVIIIIAFKLFIAY